MNQLNELAAKMLVLTNALKQTTAKLERRTINANIAKTKSKLIPLLPEEHYRRIDPLIIGNIKLWYTNGILKCSPFKRIKKDL